MERKSKNHRKKKNCLHVESKRKALQALTGCHSTLVVDFLDKLAFRHLELHAARLPDGGEIHGVATNARMLTTCKSWRNKIPQLMQTKRGTQSKLNQMEWNHNEHCGRASVRQELGGHLTAASDFSKQIKHQHPPILYLSKVLALCVLMELCAALSISLT